MRPWTEQRWISLTLTHAELREALGLPSDARIIAVSEDYGPGADRVSLTISSPHLPEVSSTGAVQSCGLAEARFYTTPRD